GAVVRDFGRLDLRCRRAGRNGLLLGCFGSEQGCLVRRRLRNLNHGHVLVSFKVVAGFVDGLLRASKSWMPIRAKAEHDNPSCWARAANSARCDGAMRISSLSIPDKLRLRAGRRQFTHVTQASSGGG